MSPTKSRGTETDNIVRRARVRALAAAVADTPTRERDFRHLIGRSLRGSDRRRQHAAPPKRPTAQRDSEPARGFALGVLAVQLLAFLALMFLPTFQVKSIVITGDHLLTRQAVLAAADIPQRSIFAVDAAGIRQRLESVAWIKSVSVTTQLPNVVRINLVEWAPALRLHRGSQDTLISDSGAVLPVSPGRSDLINKVPVLIDERTTSNATAPNASLVQMLDQTSSHFAAVFGCTIVAYEWQSDGVFRIWTSTGWAALLGHIDNGAAVASIPDQLSALAALKSRLNFAAPTFGYVDLENPQTPAVGGTPGLPVAVALALEPSAASTTPLAKAPTPAQPSALPSPIAQAAKPSAAPSAAPGPTPFIFYVQSPTH